MPSISRSQCEFSVAQGRITLPRYAYPTHETRQLERTDIVEVIDWHPPAIRTVTGEFLFVSREHLDTLKGFCAEQTIPFTERYDIWSDLLEPFLDTEFTPAQQAVTIARIEAAGFTSGEIKALRAEVSGPMLSLTALTWEWQCYGLYDVLLTMKPTFPIGQKAWRKFHLRAMAVALRGVEAG